MHIYHINTSPTKLTTPPLQSLMTVPIPVVERMLQVHPDKLLDLTLARVISTVPVLVIPKAYVSPVGPWLSGMQKVDPSHHPYGEQVLAPAHHALEVHLFGP